MVSRYVPERGDIVWLQFDPQAGHEQAGHRPALTVSPGAYNRKTGLALFCPITSKVKGNPFEVAFCAKKVSGAILADQLKSLDWRARKASYAEAVSKVILAETLAKIAPLLAASSR
jgi:mRNA interferase MazF